MSKRTFTRRRFLGTTAAASAAIVGAPYIRTSHAAGSLAGGFWDHWVPGANNVLTTLCNEWAAKEKVDITVDFITSVGDKLLLTLSAEAQAKVGHDLLSFQLWYAAGQAENLIPLDDVMNALIA